MNKHKEEDNMMKIIMLGIFIVITIIYVAFTIRGTFVTKKQIKISIIDIAYCMILGAYSGQLDISIIVIIGMFLLLWLLVISRKRNKNLIEKNRKMMKKNEEAN